MDTMTYWTDASEESGAEVTTASGGVKTTPNAVDVAIGSPLPVCNITGAG